MVIVKDGNNRVVDIGRYKVAYIGDTGEVRLIHTSTGRVLRTDPMGSWDMGEFKKIVEEYKRLTAI
jgi:hypothetical protein